MRSVADGRQVTVAHLEGLSRVADDALRAAEKAPRAEADAFIAIASDLVDIVEEGIGETSIEASLPPLERVGALALWQRELKAARNGQRANAPSTWRYDALWEAACWEAAALEAERAGLQRSAERAMERAAQIISEADDTRVGRERAA